MLEFSENRNRCLRTLADEYVSKISSRYIGKRLSFAVSNAQKGHLLRYLWGFRHFSDFQFLSGLGRSKRVLRSSFKKTLPKNLHQTLNFKFDLFDLVTLDDLQFSQGHKRLKRILRIIPYTIHVVPSNLLQFDTAALPGEGSNDRQSKSWPLTQLVMSSVTFK